MSGKLQSFVAAMVAALAITGAAFAHRAPTNEERKALDQAVYDRLFANNGISRYAVVFEQVSTLPRQGAVGSRLVSKYAFVTLKGWDRSGQFVGYQGFVAAYTTAPRVGWHIFDEGEVGPGTGCVATWYPSGDESLVLRDLKIKCVA